MFGCCQPSELIFVEFYGLRRVFARYLTVYNQIPTEIEHNFYKSLILLFFFVCGKLFLTVFYDEFL